MSDNKHEGRQSWTGVLVCSPLSRNAGSSCLGGEAGLCAHERGEWLHPGGPEAQPSHHIHRGQQWFEQASWLKNLQLTWIYGPGDYFLADFQKTWGKGTQRLNLVSCQMGAWLSAFGDLKEKGDIKLWSGAAKSGCAFPCSFFPIDRAVSEGLWEGKVRRQKPFGFLSHPLERSSLGVIQPTSNCEEKHILYAISLNVWGLFSLLAYPISINTFTKNLEKLLNCHCPRV